MFSDRGLINQTVECLLNGTLYRAWKCWLWLSRWGMCICFGACQVVLMVKNLPAVQRPRFDPRVREIPWRSECYSIQYSCLGYPMDREAWRAAARGVTELDRTHCACMHTCTQYSKIPEMKLTFRIVWITGRYSNGCSIKFITFPQLQGLPNI